MTLMSLGLTRGLIGQAIGMVVGMLLIVITRPMLGLDPVWAPDAVWLSMAILGTIGFMFGVGSLTDWFQWMRIGLTPIPHGPPKGVPAWVRYFNVDYNHKVIGIQYTVTALICLMLGGGFALVFRTELAGAELQFLDANTYNTLIGMHGWMALFSIFIGIGGMANYLVPLMIGAEDMAYPRLNAFAFWINIPAFVLLLMSLPLGWDSGWTAYPPLSLRGPAGFQLFLFSVYGLGLSSILGGLNLVATILTMRPKGMSLFRMPIFCWAILATSLIQMTATQVIGQAFLMVAFERALGLHFFDPAHGGNPILFQHLFWFYSHPAVYVWVLPGLGIISELLPVFSRKPLFGYRWIALSSMAIALVGFLVWGHHMFTSGYSTYLRYPFMIATLFVAVPTGVKFFSWLGTIWGGKLTFPTPMLFVLGSISVFLLGGLSGPILATVASDFPLHDSYFVVGHFHATVFGGFVFPLFAAIYFWYPKVMGRMYDERLGKLHFWIMTPAFWVMSLVQMSIGVMGMRRRISDYDPALGNNLIEAGHVLITVAGFAIAFSILLFIYNIFNSAEVGETAGDNPWRSRSPEWQIPSPVPEHSYAHPITITGEPYDYGLPGSVYVRTTPAGAGDD